MVKEMVNALSNIQKLIVLIQLTIKLWYLMVNH